MKGNTSTTSLFRDKSNFKHRKKVTRKTISTAPGQIAEEMQKFVKVLQTKEEQELHHYFLNNPELLHGR